MASPERKQLTVNDHLFGPGPKRMLALDGGGVRGILSLGYLSHIEQILQKRNGNDFRLCDYFDLIGGTSTGAIIATALALGFRVEEIQELYRQLAKEIFKKPFWSLGLIGSKFPKDPLEPVSYTHLDVYKRQTLGGCVSARGANRWLSLRVWRLRHLQTAPNPLCPQPRRQRQVVWHRVTVFCARAFAGR